MDAWELIRRLHDRQKLGDLARAVGLDRKTVRNYKRLALSAGISFEEPLPDKEEALRRLQTTLGGSSVGRTPQAQALLLPYLDEINSLMNPFGMRLPSPFISSTTTSSACI
jgi:hypothetical protein